MLSTRTVSSLIILGALGTWTATASRADDPPTLPNQVGEFVEKTQFRLMFVTTSEECSDNGGTWIPSETPGEEFCLVDAENTVIVEKSSTRKLRASVETIGVNFHMCSFEGEGRIRSADPRTVVFKEVGPDAGNCRVTLKFNENFSAVEAVASSHCEMNCGASVSLSISKADRIL